MAATPGYNEDETPLTRLATRRTRSGAPFLTEEEARAGERLRSDFTRAGLMASITQRWDAQPRQKGGAGAGARDISDFAIDARGRVNAAVEAVGPELAGVLLDICCFLKGLELVERERQWPARSAKLLLKAGLGVLARHYGFEPAGASRTRRAHRWATADYRPVIGGKA